jgi:hypothetical protein
MILPIRIRCRRNLSDAISQQFNLLYSENVSSLYLQDQICYRFGKIPVNIFSLYRYRCIQAKYFDFPASELELNMLLISNSISDLLPFLNLADGNSRSIFNLFEFMAAPAFF